MIQIFISLYTSCISCKKNLCWCFDLEEHITANSSTPSNDCSLLNTCLPLC